MTAPAPLVYPLAGLLAEPAGTERRYDIHGATIQLPDELHLAEPIDGTVRIIRTNRGVYVDAKLSTAIDGQCSRCLRDVEIPTNVEIHEEVLPSLDPLTGIAVRDFEVRGLIFVAPTFERFDFFVAESMCRNFTDSHIYFV